MPGSMEFQQTEGIKEVVVIGVEIVAEKVGSMVIGYNHTQNE